VCVCAGIFGIDLPYLFLPTGTVLYWCGAERMTTNCMLLPRSMIPSLIPLPRPQGLSWELANECVCVGEGAVE